MLVLLPGGRGPEDCWVLQLGPELDDAVFWFAVVVVWLAPVELADGEPMVISSRLERAGWKDAGGGVVTRPPPTLLVSEMVSQGAL